ncbi:hypothetical protein CEXT_319361 [Caerostris extrusa]|uniref:Uncharacterized protein n=1 Tax=Caerostris extrusa TaxID=172846 RepID=A0AAV4R9F7_CAEEX|nr:hypothetical protein CEXT_319361 [Caerostris extrusa]
MQIRRKKNRPDKETTHKKSSSPICHGMTNHNELIRLSRRSSLCSKRPIMFPTLSDFAAAFGRTCSILNLLLLLALVLWRSIEHVAKMFCCNGMNGHVPDAFIKKTYSGILLASALPSVIRIVRSVSSSRIHSSSYLFATRMA